MGTLLIWTLLLAPSCVIFTNGQAYFDDLSDLRGPYCANTGCCDGRQDQCSAPILGTSCYCDSFCNATRVGDCCPDYWSHCRGITTPVPVTIPTTTRRPAPLTSCYHNGRTLFYKSKIQDNCNECVCERVGDKVETMCSSNVCLIDPAINNVINNNNQYGWAATNYSEFWGRTLDDGVTYRLGTFHPQKFVMRINPVRRIYDPTNLPRTFDANEKWSKFISEIQDQQWCGASWAISTAAVASDRYAIISKGMENVRLSPQNLLSCDTKGQQSCKGGYLDRAWSYFRKFGLVDENCFPYVGQNEKCKIKRRGSLLESGCSAPERIERKSKYRVGPAYRLGNETDIMYEITKSGPVQATMKVYHDFFSYQNGIYKHTDLSASQKIGYHSVRIIGWGEEFTYKGIEKYWKVANSWGTNWGEQGYFRIARGTNECEIESFVLGVWPEVEKKILLRNINNV